MKPPLVSKMKLYSTPVVVTYSGTYNSWQKAYSVMVGISVL
jgi:hypothetical protein